MANGADFQKHRSGDPFRQTARFQNALVDTIHRSKANEQAIGGRSKPQFRDFDVVKVKNDSGSDRDQYEILGLNGPLVLPEENEVEFRRQVAFNGVTPTDAHSGRFCILLDAIPDGEIGRAVVSGCVAVQIKVFDEADEFADVDDGDPTALISSATGPAGILWIADESSSEEGGSSSEGSSGEVASAPRWAIVRLSNEGGGGGGGCESANAIIHVTIAGSPTGGTFDWPLEVNDSEETMQFDWDATAAEVKTELETHSEIAEGDVSVSGGPFPDAAIQIEFTGDLANTPIKLPIPSFASLTGGTGRNVMSHFAQRGFA